MNSIRQVQALNKRELEAGVSPEASWHADYRDTAYIYVGGLPFDLSEGDIITIFSQYGEPVFINLVRDKETGKSKGFGFLKYEDQRSTDLAVDNLGGATVMGKMLRVDHTRYKKKDDEDLGDNTMGNQNEDAGTKSAKRDGGSESGFEDRKKPVLKEELELQELMREYDDEDPMKAYLTQQKKEQIEAALARSQPKSDRRNKKHSRERDGDAGNEAASTIHWLHEQTVKMDPRAVKEADVGIVQIVATTGTQDQTAEKDIDEANDRATQGTELKLHSASVAKVYLVVMLPPRHV